MLEDIIGEEVEESGWKFTKYPDTELGLSTMTAKERNDEHLHAISDKLPRCIHIEPPMTATGHQLVARLRQEFELIGGWQQNNTILKLSHRRDDDVVTAALEFFREQIESMPGTAPKSAYVQVQPCELLKIRFPDRNPRFLDGGFLEEGKELASDEGPNAVRGMVGTSNGALAEMYWHKGDLEMAENLYRECLERAEGVLPVDDRTRMAIVMELAQVLVEQKIQEGKMGVEAGTGDGLLLL
ncbi:hypothetical protein HDV00_007105 [Rhizophlyctis rosea]|nr:hypothetical protein HDV00_007105 [Rhizophlyctis rosea]